MLDLINKIERLKAQVHTHSTVGSKMESVYFIGIGGIGMSALARYIHSIGIKVSGYDKTETVLTKQLIKEGIDVHFADDINLLDKNAGIVVYTPAVPKNHLEYNFYLEHQYTVVKRSDLLGAVTNASFNICIAGTHGKTTTSTMVAHILRHSKFGCNAFLGGIAVNYNTNFWSSQNNVCVVEADEYDRSFLKLNPDVAIISSMDADHLDIYGTAENMEQAFIDFSTKIKPGGLLLSKFGLSRTKELVATNHWSYHLQDKQAAVYADNITAVNGSYHFDVYVNRKLINDVVLNMGGMHNIENVLAAIAIAQYLNIDDDKIKDAVATFRGVKRRFEYILLPSPSQIGRAEVELVMIDDYAHHPEELRALISGAKLLFPEKSCTIIFQPHLYTRTKDHAAGFASVLDLADEVILLPIYPARELPLEGVASEIIIEKMQNKNSRVLEKEKVLDWVKNNKIELLITAGAGDIDTMVDPIKNILTNKN